MARACVGEWSEWRGEEMTKTRQAFFRGGTQKTCLAAYSAPPTRSSTHKMPLLFAAICDAEHRPAGRVRRPLWLRPRRAARLSAIARSRSIPPPRSAAPAQSSVAPFRRDDGQRGSRFFRSVKAAYGCRRRATKRQRLRVCGHRAARADLSARWELARRSSRPSHRP